MRKKHHLIIFCLGILIFCSCSISTKAFFNFTNSKIYGSFAEVEPILLKQKQLKKMSKKNFTILYSYDRWKEMKPLYFFSNGKPILRSSCGMPKLGETINCKIVFSDSLDLSYVIKDLVTKDSLPFTKTLQDYDYVVLMPKSTFLQGLDKRTIRDILLTLPKNSNIYFIFVNIDYYFWQIPESKAGQKMEMRFENQSKNQSKKRNKGCTLENNCSK